MKITTDHSPLKLASVTGTNLPWWYAVVLNAGIWELIKVWHETSPAVGKAKFPLVGDPTHTLSRAFGVHIEEEGLALRGTFIINPEGKIKTMEVHDNSIARDVKETLRKLKAAQFVAKNPGQVCPAKWNEGAQTLTPSLDLVGKI